MDEKGVENSVVHLVYIELDNQNLVAHWLQ